MPPWPIPLGCSRTAWVPSNASAGSSRTGTPPEPSWLTPRRAWSRFSTTWELTELACSIKGLSPVGAAAILAETGDLRRFTSARAVVKHAGLAPRQRLSGTFAGRARLSGAGRPHLRTAAWRAVWGAVKSNSVYAERYRHLTTRETNKLKPTQAQTVLAGAILRQLHAVITTGQAWDPDIATHGARGKPSALMEVAA
jgi:transposase